MLEKSIKKQKAVLQTSVSMPQTSVNLYAYPSLAPGQAQSMPPSYAPAPGQAQTMQPSYAPAPGQAQTMPRRYASVVASSPGQAQTKQPSNTPAP